MVPTTIKLPTELRARISRLAKKSSQSPHAWMLDALKSQASHDEAWNEFVSDAEEAAKEIDAGAPVYAMEDVHRYLSERLQGRKSSLKPLPKKRRKP